MKHRDAIGSAAPAGARWTLLTDGKAEARRQEVTGTDVNRRVVTRQSSQSSMVVFIESQEERARAP